ncbi:FAD-binding oxidoreductase [Phanerochaete sordida]|uniref:FAD-binding oxidoreductase n=1 Tax=Phanerochaete sordida TaxID=48140 RepID=A0A9P3G7R8_9APHY|nr:FAD-binding oxidoreductase [Phanerochaete sordida]
MAQPSENAPHIVILGAGVIGLSAAHVLSERYPSYKFTVVARDLPEEADMNSQAWASPWAGADWSPIGDFEEKRYKRELTTFNRLWDMIPSGLVRTLPSRICYTEEIDDAKIWYKDLVRDFRILDKDEVPSGAVAGVAFTTVSLNPQLYLPWLRAELAARGVTFLRRRVASIQEAAELAGRGGALVNATALGARSLIGVQDTAVYPIRGQTLLAYAPRVQEFLSYPLGLGAVPTGEATYMIPRPAPPGHVLIGGTFQEDCWDLSVDYGTARSIWRRCLELAPALSDPDVRVLGHNVGLRPARRGGARIEAQWYTLPLESEFLPPPAEGAEKYDFLVIHAYGFGPAGYQGSWGAAEEVAEIFAEHFKPSA